MPGTYAMPWGAPHPGCLIFLLDQSGSMAGKFGATQSGFGKAKSEVVATLLNRALDDFILACTSGKEVRARGHFAVLGYDGAAVRSALPPAIAGSDFVTPDELRNNPRHIDLRKQKTIDDTGNEIEEEVYFNQWVSPVSGGGTPMCAALKKARTLAQQWASSHPDNYPPIVVNITDGVATDGQPSDVQAAADALTQVTTADGSTLLFTCHITDLGDTPIEFPSGESEVPSDAYARLMYRISSEIPDSSRDIYKQFVGRELIPGTRGYIFNGDASSVRKFLNFSSVGGLSRPDPNM